MDSRRSSTFRLLTASTLAVLLGVGLASGAGMRDCPHHDLGPDGGNEHGGHEVAGASLAHQNHDPGPHETAPCSCLNAATCSVAPGAPASPADVWGSGDADRRVSVERRDTGTLTLRTPYLLPWATAPPIA